jgi:anti-sigma B factor antagonist
MKIRQIGGIAIIDVTGTVRFGPESDKFREGILAEFDKGTKKILLNLAALERMDSSGLGSLVSVYASITRRGGVVKLLNPGQRVLELLKVTNTAGLFQICMDEQAAMASFGPG